MAIPLIYNIVGVDLTQGLLMRNRTFDLIFAFMGVEWIVVQSAHPGLSFGFGSLVNSCRIRSILRG